MSRAIVPFVIAVIAIVLGAVVFRSYMSRPIPPPDARGSAALDAAPATGDHAVDRPR